MHIDTSTEELALDRLRATARETLTVALILIEEQCKAASQTATEAILNIVGERFADVEARLADLEERMQRSPPAAVPVRENGAASRWTRFLRLFQGAARVAPQK